METVIPTEWLTFLTGVDLQVMAAIGVLAFLMTRSPRISAEVALWFPSGLGACWGLIEALSVNEQAAGWRLVALVFKGFALNGAAAALIGRGVAKLVGRFWDSVDPPPAGGAS